MSHRTQARRIVLTGVSRGLGRAMLAGFAQGGHTVCGCARSAQAIDELPKGMAAVPVNPGITHTEMLESCFGASAASYLDPQTWARSAVPFLLGLGPQHNGQQLTLPGQE